MLRRVARSRINISALSMEREGVRGPASANPSSFDHARVMSACLLPPKIANKDMLRDDAIGLDLIGIDDGSGYFRRFDVTLGIADLHVLRLMDLAHNLIGLDPVRIDRIGANLIGLDLIRPDCLRRHRHGRLRRCRHVLHRRRGRRRHDHRGRWFLRGSNADVLGPRPPDWERESDDPNCGCDPCTTSHVMCPPDVLDFAVYELRRAMSWSSIDDAIRPRTRK